MRSLERALLTSADGVVTLLPKSVDYFVGHGLTGDRVCVIPNGIDLGAVPPGTPPRRHSGPFEVVYAGAHGAANGLDTVLDAAAALRDVSVRFVLYGDGPERPRLAERVRNEGLDCVELRGAVPKVQIHEALARADAGLLVLSKMDVFRYGVSPNKLFDYLAMGLPVVVSVDADLGALGQCPAVVQTPAGDALALARAVRTLACEDERSREERGRQGRAFVEAHHDFGVLAVRYLDFLARVLGHDVPQCPQAVS
jgi:glycosyltransferase involved in cell wall biosynthesis